MCLTSIHDFDVKELDLGMSIMFTCFLEETVLMTVPVLCIMIPEQRWRPSAHHRNPTKASHTNPASVCCHSYHSKFTPFYYFNEYLHKKGYVYNVFAIF